MKYNKEMPLKNKTDYLKNISGESSNENNKSESKQKLTLEKAHDIRKFEIDLYWRRTTYFSAFITLAFVGYFEILKTSCGAINNMKDYLLLLITALGFILSLCWFFNNKASKYWQETWERHVELLEDEVTGPLYKTTLEYGSGKSSKISPLKPFHYSIPKINQLLSFVVVIVWACIFLYTLFMIFQYNFCIHFEYGKPVFAVSILIGTIIVAFCMFHCCSKVSKNKGSGQKDEDFIMCQRNLD